MHWTPAVMLQAEDRIHRMGQKNTTCVNYHYLYGEGTLDSLLYEKLQSKLAIVSEILEGKTAYLEVEDTKEQLGEFTPAPEELSTGKKRKDAYGKERSSTGSVKPAEKTVGMAQITSYFKKRQNPTSDTTPEAVSKDHERRVKSEMLGNSDSMNWDEVEKLLEEDQVKKGLGVIDEEDDGYVFEEKRKLITPFVDVGDEYEDAELFNQQERDEIHVQRTEEEQKKFENSMFYSCLDEIYQNKEAKEKDIITKDIREFFPKEKEMRKQEAKKDERNLKDEALNGRVDDLLLLWNGGNKNKEKTNLWQSGSAKKQVHKREETDSKTPVRNLGTSASKTGGSITKGAFRFSMQLPVQNNKMKENLPEELSTTKSARKRKFDLLEFDDSQPLEAGITSDITKKVKESS